jgi:hypothetical protein
MPFSLRAPKNICPLRAQCVRLCGGAALGLLAGVRTLLDAL